MGGAEHGWDDKYVYPGPKTITDKIIDKVGGPALGPGEGKPSGKTAGIASDEDKKLMKKHGVRGVIVDDNDETYFFRGGQKIVVKKGRGIGD